MDLANEVRDRASALQISVGNAKRSRLQEPSIVNL